MPAFPGADYEVEMLVRVYLDAKEIESGDTPADTAEKLIRTCGGVEVVEVYYSGDPDSRDLDPDDVSDVYGSAIE